MPRADGSRVPVARGPRVVLFEPEDSDGRELVALVRESRKFLRPWVHPPEDLKGYRRYLAGPATGRAKAFLVCRRSDAAILGVVNMSEIVRGAFQSAYLGFYVGSRYAGQGYMSQGLALVVRHAFRKMKLHRFTQKTPRV